MLLPATPYVNQSEERDQRARAHEQPRTTNTHEQNKKPGHQRSAASAGLGHGSLQPARWPPSCSNLLAESVESWSRIGEFHHAHMKNVAGMGLLPELRGKVHSAGGAGVAADWRRGQVGTQSRGRATVRLHGVLGSIPQAAGTIAHIAGTIAQTGTIRDQSLGPRRDFGAICCCVLRSAILSSMTAAVPRRVTTHRCRRS